MQLTIVNKLFRCAAASMLAVVLAVAALPATCFAAEVAVAPGYTGEVYDLSYMDASAADPTDPDVAQVIAELEAVSNMDAAVSNESSPDSDAAASDSNVFQTQSMTLSNYQKFMGQAFKYNGKKYVWGGRSPADGGFDCTGLVMYAYNLAFNCAIDTEMTNAEKLYKNFCRPVDNNAAKPGDLVFFRGTYGTKVDYISHVGIYCGGDLCFAAAGTKIGFYRISTTENIKGKPAAYFFGALTATDEGDKVGGFESVPGMIAMHRLYNRWSGEHLYTSSIEERDKLVFLGWRYENIGWLAPTSGSDVYRLYNPYSGDHHYTMDKKERKNLVKKGWIDEGVGWKSAAATLEGAVPVYRQFNKYATVGTHNYTTDKAENDKLKSIGWKAEGIAWYGLPL